MQARTQRDVAFFDGSVRQLTYRVRWAPVGTDAYEAWSEARNGDAWTTMFKLTLKQSS